MPNAQHSFILLWRRVVAALSLVAAALLASMAASPVSNSGVVGSRAGLAGPGATFASPPSVLIASLDAIADGGQRTFPSEDTGGGSGKALVPAPWRALSSPPPPVVALAPEAGELPRQHAARYGLTRAPPRA